MPEITVFNLPKPQETKTLQISPSQKPNQECFVGRDDRCCVVLDDMVISRLHGKITFCDGIYYYKDLGSRNGSRINNQRLTANQNYPLKASDTIAIGNHLIWINAISKRSATQVGKKSISQVAEQPESVSSSKKLSRQKARKLKVNCVQIIEETPNVKTFRFVADSPQLIDYKPGQFITLELNMGGKPVKRCYTISSSPSRPHTLDITVQYTHFLDQNNRPVSSVKKKPKSSELPHTIAALVNNWLYKNLKIGSKLRISQPMGKVTNYVNPAKKILLISAGIGITPLMSIARWLCDTVSNVDITFIHSARSPQDIIFLKELELMAQRYPNFKLAITLTRPEKFMSWHGYTGRLNATVLCAIAPDYQERNVYVSGSDAFRESMKSVMQSLSFPMSNYHEEISDIDQTVRQNLPPVTSQTNLKVVPSQAKTLVNTPEVAESVIASSATEEKTSLKSESIENTTPIVVFAKSGKEITFDGQKSILDHALAEGIELPYGCGMGVCGQCKLKKISGKVVYDDEEISCEDSHVLTCIAKAEGKVVLEG